MATVNVWFLVGHLAAYISTDMVGEDRENFRASTITHVLKL
ncbi:MAG: hypothetical protein R3341_04650 [Methylophaga sp.]|nr:hypothetical protein [Methylophaga sp.]